MIDIDSRDYSDIIHLDRPVSTKHRPMSMMDRAARFSPFVALTGYEDAIDNTTKLSEEEMWLKDHDYYDDDSV